MGSSNSIKKFYGRGNHKHHFGHCVDKFYLMEDIVGKNV
jgi:hypothetical protein